MGPAQRSELVVFAVAAALGLVAAWPRRASRGLGAAVIAAVLALVVLAAWPLLDAEFDTDAPVLRAAFAAVDVFGDWNHPFLPYLLNRPATWVSLEPGALRVVPLLFLGAEAALCVVAAAREEGPLAGALAGVWFACEVPRRHGLVDLGDWDFAGAFLMALVVWCQRRGEPGRRGWIALAALLGAGVFCSWLMIVPTAVLVGLLAVDAARGRAPARRVRVIALGWLLLAALAASVFVAGARSPEPGHATAIVHEMAEESPAGRNVAMLLPMALGLVAMWRRRGALAHRFVGATLLAVPLAILVAFRYSHVNGGYYVGLVTPLLCSASGVGTSRAIATIGDVWIETGARWAGRLGAALRALAAAVLAIATVDAPPAPPRPAVDDARAVLRALDDGDATIVTDSAALPRILAFERARARQGPIADVLVPAAPGALAGPPDLARRVQLAPPGCAPLRPPADDARLYLVHVRQAAPDTLASCVEPLGWRCGSVQPPDAGRRVIWISRCTR